MTVTLDLKPEEVTALHHRARAEGVGIEAVLHALVAQIPPPPAPQAPAQARAEKRELTEQQKGLAALMQEWREEDETDDPEELARRDRDLEEFMANMNRWRAEEGRLPVYE